MVTFLGTISKSILNDPVFFSLSGSEYSLRGMVVRRRVTDTFTWLQQQQQKKKQLSATVSTSTSTSVSVLTPALLSNSSESKRSFFQSFVFLPTKKALFASLVPRLKPKRQLSPFLSQRRLEAKVSKTGAKKVQSETIETKVFSKKISSELDGGEEMNWGSFWPRLTFPTRLGFNTSIRTGLLHSFRALFTN